VRYIFPVGTGRGRVIRDGWLLGWMIRGGVQGMRVGDRLGGWVAWKVSEGRCCRQVHLAKAVIVLVYIVALYLRVSIQGFPYRHSALTDFLGEGMCCFWFDCRVFGRGRGLKIEM